MLTSSPEVWVHANKDKRYRKDEWMYHTVRFEYRRDGIFSQTDNEKHSARRKQLTPGVSSFKRAWPSLLDNGVAD